MNSALRIIARSVLHGVATLVALTFITYLVFDWTIDGGVASVMQGACPRDATEGPCKAIIDQYRLDDPMPIRYLKWLGDAVTGDLNRTADNGTPVIDVIRHRAPVTTQLALTSIALSILVAIPLGVFSAARDHKRTGRTVAALVQVAQSVPVFVSGLLLIRTFAELLGVLPAAGWIRLADSYSGNIERLILPAVTLALAEIGLFVRVVRADLLQTFQTEFMNAAMVKGLAPRYLLFRHALRPSSLGLLTVIALSTSTMLGGAVVVEIVFGLPGLGRELLRGIGGRDIYLVLGMMTYVGAIYVIVNTIVDWTYTRVDPRISDLRLQRHVTT